LRAKFLRDTIIRDLKQEYSGITTAEINGAFFSGADISIPQKQGDCKSFRIVVIPQHLDKTYLDKISQ